MRDHIRFVLNGHEQLVRGNLAFATLAEYLRWELGLCGTKVVCAEGDCGACTVLLKSQATGSRSVPVDSCIQFVFQLDGCDVVTVEGLNQDGELNAVQKAMVDCHGSQCGYCTPGFIMAMSGWRENGANLDDARIALTGNLCRCTGYVPILEAMQNLSRFQLPNESPRTATCDDQSLRIEFESRVFFAPSNLAAAIEFKANHPDAVIVAGATELGVLRNKRGIEPQHFLSLRRIRELNALTVESGALAIGANVTWADLEPLVKNKLPQLRRIVERFGSPQIRHAATIVGNVANGSPIADSLPWLCVMDAQLEITGPRGTFFRSINGFYTGYKQRDIGGDELITKIVVPMPTSQERLRCYKISRRMDLDISTFCAAIRLSMDGNRIESAAIAFGGVAPTVVRLPKTEQFLSGHELSEFTFRQAGLIARSEVDPITDVRGSADFRLQLCENIFAKFFFDEINSHTEAAA